MSENPKAQLVLGKRAVRADSRSIHQLMLELIEWIDEDPIDDEMVVPICQEIQGRLQTLRSRVEKLAAFQEKEEL